MYNRCDLPFDPNDIDNFMWFSNTSDASNNSNHNNLDSQRVSYLLKNLSSEKSLLTQTSSIINDKENKNASLVDMQKFMERILPPIYYLKRLQAQRIQFSAIKKELEKFLAQWENTSVGEDFLEWAVSFDELKYESAVIEYANELDSNANTLPYLGFYEDTVHTELKERLRSTTRASSATPLFRNYDKQLATCICTNFEIRDRLCNDVLVGVVGLKNVGKSTFVELVADLPKNALSGLSMETTTMMAFSIGPGNVLIDYPHSDGVIAQYEAQYKCSRYLLNYVFVICKAKEIGESSTIWLECLLRTIKIDSVWRVCLVMNRVDELNSNNDDDDDGGGQDLCQILDNYRSVLIDSLKKIDRDRNLVTKSSDYEKIRVIATCLVDEPTAKMICETVNEKKKAEREQKKREEEEKNEKAMMDVKERKKPMKEKRKKKDSKSIDSDWNQIYSRENLKEKILSIIKEETW